MIMILSFRGFSYVDLIEDARTHKDYALKRITCHSKEEERVALQEIELMRTFQHPNVISLEESSVIKVNQYSKHLDIISEVLIVMPFYCVSFSPIPNQFKYAHDFKITRLWINLCERFPAILHYLSFLQISSPSAHFWFNYFYCLSMGKLRFHLLKILFLPFQVEK